MKRREFISTSLGGIAALRSSSGFSAESTRLQSSNIRSQFPRLDTEVFLNAAGGTPLGNFAETGMQKYLTLIREGPQGGTRGYFDTVLDEVATKFAQLVGAQTDEIGFVECTKRGEQIALDSVAEKLNRGGNIVSNDLHFSGSLHNLEGQRRTGREVRIVKSEDYAVSAQRMADQIDSNTALVTLSLVSNVSGHIEAIADIASVAHDHGALVFADIIQAAGVVPIDAKTMGIDIAACSSYKWLYGIHGAGFLYVAQEHQGTSLPDTLFPGRGVRNYPPFRSKANPEQSDIAFRAPTTASRYQPGHINYLGYCAAYEGLKFIESIGVEQLQSHSVALNRRLLEQLDTSSFEIMSHHLDQSPILTVATSEFDTLRDRLRNSDVNVGIGGDKWNQIRISPAIYNNENDMDKLAEILRTA
ncbi:MAG: aminotransferase class V-fold PLP-dependent enzyme [Pseudomonadales bacterium]|nr:aminotransferase class V-fold PLP-dependent enzyme [Pseudomonadales bacterium]